MDTRLDLQLRQKLVMTPQLQQAIRLLQLSRMELAQEIQQQMIENPLIEEVGSDSPDEDIASPDTEETPSSESSEEADITDLKWDNNGDDEWDKTESRLTWEVPEERPSYEATLARPDSLSDHLLWQLGLFDFSESDRAIGEVIIGDINEDGYLESTLDELVYETGAPSRASVEKVLHVIQEFDPPGVGGRNLVECLLIQVRLLGLAHSLVARIIENHLAALEKRQYVAIAKACDVLQEEVLQAAKIVEHLEPKPGRPFCSEHNFNIVPDAFVVKTEELTAPFPGEKNDERCANGISPERYVVILNEEGMPRARISAYYRSILKLKGADTEGTRAYLEEKFRSAVWFIRSLDQRNRTILKVIEAIVRFQEPFMEHGVASLKPLVLKQVADEIGMHESTVSRVTANKYIYTLQGTYPLKFFFSSALATTGPGESVSSSAVRERIGNMVAKEDPLHPLTDAKIVERLRRENVEVARRTVSKYRAELNIAAASQRKRLH